MSESDLVSGRGARSAGWLHILDHIKTGRCESSGLSLIYTEGLVLQLGRKKFAVEAGDVGDRDRLGALGLTSAGVGAVAES